MKKVVYATLNGQPTPVTFTAGGQQLEVSEPSRCVGCASLDMVYEVIDEKGQFPAGLGGDWCHECFEKALDREKPRCARCGATNELTHTTDEKGMLDGYFCEYCTRFLVKMVLWSKTNAKAAAYLEAFREQSALLGGSLVAVQQVHAEVRRIIPQERNGA